MKKYMWVIMHKIDRRVAIIHMRLGDSIYKIPAIFLSRQQARDMLPNIGYNWYYTIRKVKNEVIEE